MTIFKNYVQKSLLNSYLSLQQVRFYPRWSHRRPVRVYTSEEYETIQTKSGHKHDGVNDNSRSDIHSNIHNNCEIVERVEKVTSELSEMAETKNEEVEDFGFEKIKQPKTVMLRKPIHKKEIPKVDMLEVTVDAQGNLVYTKMKHKDTRITSIFVNLKSKKSKESILLEGKRLIKEALLAKCRLQYVLFSRKDDIEDLKHYLPKTGAKLYKMPYNEMQAWSELTTTPGIMAIFKIPDLTKIERKSGEYLPLTVICDNVREPGNLGAVLRISAGLGCENVILTKGCTDLWNFKVLRSACGAHFKIPIEHKIDWSEIRDKIKNSTLLIADNNNNNSTSTEIPILPYVDINYKLCEKITLIIGGETEGISDESYKLATECNGCRINIPLANDVESLNTGSALGIIAFEIRRQLLERSCEDVEENHVQ